MARLKAFRYATGFPHTLKQNHSSTTLIFQTKIKNTGMETEK